MTVFGMLLWGGSWCAGMAESAFPDSPDSVTQSLHVCTAFMAASLCQYTPQQATQQSLFPRPKSHVVACWIAVSPCTVWTPYYESIGRHYNMSNVKQLQHGVTSRLTAARLEKKSKHRLRSEN